MLSKIDHINVVVNNLNEAIIFFMELGFVVHREEILEGSWIDTLTGMNNVKAAFCGLSLPGGTTSLELLQYDNPVGDKDPKMGNPNQIGFRHVAFEVNNIEKVVDSLKKKGVFFLSAIQTIEETKKKLCYFKGPEGILLEIAEYEKQ